MYFWNFKGVMAWIIATSVFIGSTFPIIFNVLFGHYLVLLNRWVQITILIFYLLPRVFNYKMKHLILRTLNSRIDKIFVIVELNKRRNSEFSEEKFNGFELTVVCSPVIKRTKQKLYIS